MLACAYIVNIYICRYIKICVLKNRCINVDTLHILPLRALPAKLLGPLSGLMVGWADGWVATSGSKAWKSAFKPFCFFLRGLHSIYWMCICRLVLVPERIWYALKGCTIADYKTLWRRKVDTNGNSDANADANGYVVVDYASNNNT